MNCHTERRLVKQVFYSRSLLYNSLETVGMPCLYLVTLLQMLSGVKNLLTWKIYFSISLYLSASNQTIIEIPLCTSLGIRLDNISSLLSDSIHWLAGIRTR